jgi:hypothetical protein
MTPPPPAPPRGSLPPLAPELAARLREQVAAVDAALAAGQDAAAAAPLVTPAPEDPFWDQHLMVALAELAYPALPALLVALFGDARDKLRRKALKRALHLLQTRGVPVPPGLLPREEPDFGVSRPGSYKATVSPFFGVGLLYVILEGPQETLRGNILACRLSDLEGFKECHLLTLKPRQVSELWKNFQQQGLTDWFSPPPPLAVRLLEEAYARAPQAEGARRYAALREKIFKFWGRPDQAPPLEELLPSVEAVEVPRLAAQAGDLAPQPMFQAWSPGLDEIEPWLKRLEEAKESPLVLSEQQQQDRSDRVMEDAVKALYPPETRPDWSRRLLFMSYLFELTDRREEARLAYAASQELATTTPSSLAGENVFLRALVQQSLQMARSLKKSPGKPPFPGLVTPPESLIVPR